MGFGNSELTLNGFFSKLIEMFNSEPVIKRLDTLHILLSEESYKNCPEYQAFFDNYSLSDVDDLVNDRNENCDLLTCESVSSLKGYIEKIYGEIREIVHQDRIDTLNECFEVYRIGAYKACALLVLSQIEGLMNQFINYKNKIIVDAQSPKRNSKPSGLHDKKELFYSYEKDMHDPFPIFKRVFTNLVQFERNTMSHDGILNDAKIKSFFFFVILLSVAGNIRYMLNKAPQHSNNESI